jgi:outer membrane protein
MFVNFGDNEERSAFRISAAIGAVALALNSPSAAANDLLQFYQLAVRNDMTLQAAGAQRDAAIEGRPQALAQLLPQVSASSSTTRERLGYQSASSGTIQSQGCDSSNDGSQRCMANVGVATLSLSQTLWSFESFSRLREANRQAASAQATFMSAQQSVLLRVAQAYFAMLGAEDLLAATRSERDAFGVLLNEAKGRQQAGVGPRSDVEQAQAFYDSTEQPLIDARNAVDDARLALVEIVGVRVDEIAPLRAEIPLVPPEPDSVEEWVAAARRDNPLVRAAELMVEAADLDVSTQRGKGLPNIALTGSSSRTWQDQVLGGNQSLDMVGISLNWPLFQSGAVASAMRQSRALYRQAEAQYETSLRDSERQTRAAFRGIVTGIQRITSARRAVDSAQAAVEASRTNVQFGTGTEFDLLNAQNNYSTAVRAYSQTRYDYLSNLLILKQQAGRLGEGDLGNIDALLTSRE